MTLFGIETNYNKFKLNSTYWKEVGLDSLESYNNTFKYYLISKSEQKTFDLVIIARKHTEENIHWTCIINKEGKLVDWCVTAYDNSEGFLSIKSQFEGMTFLVTEWNIYSSPNETKRKYTITKCGLIESEK